MEMHDLQTVGEATINDLTMDNENITSFDALKNNKNRIINGDFDIWQRGVTQTVNGYTSVDRWKFGIVGSSFSASRQSFTLGQTDVPNNPKYYMRNVVTSSAGAGNYSLMVHYIEDVTQLTGESAILSFWAKADSSKNIAIEFLQVFGSGGSPSATINGIGVTTCSLTSSWQKFEVPVSLPSVSGKTLGTSNNDHLQIAFWFDAGSDFNARTNSLGQQSGTFDISHVQIEKGTIASDFEFRSKGEELALCQRYYEKSYGDTSYPGDIDTVGSIYRILPKVIANGGGWGSLIFATRKRAAPTVTGYSTTTGASGKCHNQTVAADRSAGTYQSTNKGFLFYYSDGTSSGDQHILWMQWDADAEL